MRSPQSPFKLRTAATAICLAGGCAALIGFGLVGSDDARYSGFSQTRLSLFDDGAANAKSPGAEADRTGSLRRLGLSASLEETPADEMAIAGLAATASADEKQDKDPALRRAALDPAQDPHLQPDEVAVGDRITVVTADGLSHVYKVTAREIADPESGLSPKSTGQVPVGQSSAIAKSCETLNSFVAGAFRLVIESVASDKDPRITSEQKL